MSRLHEAVGEYLALRRSVGFKLHGAASLLRDFVSYLDAEGATTVTAALALAWAKRPLNVHPHRWRQRLTVVRGFAKYLHVLDARAEVPPPDLLVARRRRLPPYLYTHAELAALVAAAGTLRPPFRAATYQTLLGLLAVTGLRLGEAIRLDRDDVNWSDGLLIVRSSKFDRSREVAVHATTVDALRAYDRRRPERPATSTPAFFLSTTGTRLIPTLVQHTFRGLVNQTGIAVGVPGRAPRLHDLRHTFAVDTVVSWYREGLDVQGRLYLLTTFLGHVDPKDTYWYLSASPELLGLAATRLEETWESSHEPARSCPTNVLHRPSDPRAPGQPLHGGGLSRRLSPARRLRTRTDGQGSLPTGLRRHRRAPGRSLPGAPRA